MKTVICTEENLPSIRDAILKEFKAYCNQCVNTPCPIRYASRIDSMPDNGEPRTAKHESLFQWGTGPQYISKGRKVAEEFTKTVILPCLEYALTIHKDRRWVYRARFNSKGAESVTLYPTNAKTGLAVSAGTRFPSEDSSEEPTQLFN